MEKQEERWEEGKMSKEGRGIRKIGRYGVKI